MDVRAVLCLLAASMSLTSGDVTLVPTLSAIVPAGLKSVNGSDAAMGCSDPMVSNGMVSCFSHSDTGFLTDGHVPEVQLNTSDWAAELVTIQRVNGNEMIYYDNVLLTFQFSTNVAITAIYIDLMLCPYSGIGAYGITIFGSDSLTFEYDLETMEPKADFLVTYRPIQTTCECKMSTIVVRIQTGERAHPVFHIVFFFSDLPHQWIHIGEVRFSNEPVPREQPLSEVLCESYTPIPDVRLMVEISPKSVTTSPNRLFSVTCTARPQLDGERIISDITFEWTRITKSQSGVESEFVMKTSTHKDTHAASNRLTTIENDMVSNITYRCKAVIPHVYNTSYIPVSVVPEPTQAPTTDGYDMPSTSGSPSEPVGTQDTNPTPTGPLQLPTSDEPSAGPSATPVVSPDTATPTGPPGVTSHQSTTPPNTIPPGSGATTPPTTQPDLITDPSPSQLPPVDPSPTPGPPSGNPQTDSSPTPPTTASVPPSSQNPPLPSTPEISTIETPPQPGSLSEPVVTNPDSPTNTSTPTEPPTSEAPSPGSPSATPVIFTPDTNTPIVGTPGESTDTTPTGSPPPPSPITEPEPHSPPSQPPPVDPTSTTTEEGTSLPTQPEESTNQRATPTSEPGHGGTTTTVGYEPTDSLQHPSDPNGLPLFIISLIAGLALVLFLALFLSVIFGFVLRRRRQPRSKTVWQTEGGYTTVPSNDSNNSNSLASSTSNGASDNRIAATNPIMHVEMATDSGEATVALSEVVSPLPAEGDGDLVPEPCKKTDLELEDMEAAILELSIVGHEQPSIPDLQVTPPTELNPPLTPDPGLNLSDDDRLTPDFDIILPGDRLTPDLDLTLSTDRLSPEFEISLPGASISGSLSDLSVEKVDLAAIASDEETGGEPSEIEPSTSDEQNGTAPVVSSERTTPTPEPSLTPQTST